VRRGHFADSCYSPFDTGDRCFIDDENFVVKKMGLFAVGIFDDGVV
jgi:hypothetical protein